MSSHTPTTVAERSRLTGRRQGQIAVAALFLAAVLVGALLLPAGKRPEPGRAETQAAASAPVPPRVASNNVAQRGDFVAVPVWGDGVAFWGDGRGRHWGPVNSVAFAADGKQLASGGHDRVVRIWDAASRRELAVLGEGPNPIALVAYSPDGRRLVACSRESNDRPAELRTWDASTFELLRSVPLPRGDHILTMLFSPDGQTVFTLSRRRADNRPMTAQIKFYDAQTSQEKKAAVTLSGLFQVMRLSADGKMLATLSGECTVWGGDNFQKLWGFTPPAGSAVAAIAFAPNGQTLAAFVSRPQGLEIKLLEAVTGNEKLTVAPGLTSLSALQWSPDNQLVALAGQRHEAGRIEPEVHVLDASTGQRRVAFSIPVPPTDLAFAPDSKTLATCGQDPSVRLWEVATGKERAASAIGHGVPVYHVAFTADDRTLVSMGGSGDPTVKTWDAASGREKSSLDLAASTKTWGATHMAMARDQHHLLVWGPQGVKHWDTGAGRERDVFASPARQLRLATISPDGSSAALATLNTVRLWDAASGQERQLPIPLTQVSMLLFSPNGKTLAIAEQRAQLPRSVIHFWDVAAGREQVAIAVADIQALAFAADGQTLAIGQANGEVLRWGVANGKDQGALVGTFPGRPTNLLAAPEGPALAAWDHKNLRVWDTTTGRERFNVAGGAWTARSMAFSRDGQKLAATTGDGHVLVWNASGSKLLDWKAPGPILSLGFSGDGRRLATGNANGTIGILHVP
jgi:WD40 repeat protein